MQTHPETWIADLVKNFALIQLVEAQRNMNEIETLKKKKKKLKKVTE